MLPAAVGEKVVKERKDEKLDISTVAFVRALT